MQKPSQSLNDFLSRINESIDKKDLDGFITALTIMSKSLNQPISMKLLKVLCIKEFNDALEYLFNNDISTIAPNLVTELTALYSSIRERDTSKLIRAIKQVDEELPVYIQWEITPRLIKHQHTSALLALLEGQLDSDTKAFKLYRPTILSSDLLTLCCSSDQLLDALISSGISLPSNICIVLAETGNFYSLQNLLGKWSVHFPQHKALDVNNDSEYDTPPAWVALISGHIECAKTLIRFGAKLNQHIRGGKYNLFHMLIHNCRNLDVIIWLLSDEFRNDFPSVLLPDINEPFDNFISILQYAQAKRPEAIEILLTHGLKRGLDVTKSTGSHTVKVILLPRGGIKLCGNAIFSAPRFIIGGIVASYNRFPLKVQNFFREHNVIIRIHEGKIIFTGTFDLTESDCSRFLEETYGDYYMACITQADECLDAFKTENLDSHLFFVDGLMHNALLRQLSILQQAKAYLYLAESAYYKKIYYEAVKYYFKSKSLANTLKNNFFTDEYHSKMASCQHHVVSQLFKEQYAGIITKSEGRATVSPSGYTFRGRVFYNGLILRNPSPCLQRDLLIQLGFQIIAQDNVMITTGPVFQYPTYMILEQLAVRQGNSIVNYCLNEAVNCLHHFKHSNNYEELNDAEWFLQLSLQISTDALEQTKAYLYLGNIELARGENIFALSYFRLALAHTTQTDLLTNVDVLFDEISKYQHLAEEISSLQKEQMLDINYLNELFRVPQYVMNIRSAFKALKNMGLLNSTNANLILEKPSEALWIAERLGGKPKTTDVTAKCFVKTRYYARHLLLANHQGPNGEISPLSVLPVDVKAYILSLTVDKEMSQQATERTALLALLEQKDDKNRFGYP